MKPRALDNVLQRVVWELRAANPDALGHLEPSAVLFVFGAARRDAKASIRPLTYGPVQGHELSRNGRWQKPRIRIGGHRILYEICLRPRFFLCSSGQERAATIAHELWHASTQFDGTLAAERRHSSGAEFDREIEAVLMNWRAHRESPASEVALCESGLVDLPAWLSRPPTRFHVDSEERIDYDENDLFRSMIQMSN